MVMCCRMYDRTMKPIPEPPTTGLGYRIETLLGITGIKMAKYRSSLLHGLVSQIDVLWRPHVLSILIFEVCLPSNSDGFVINLAVRACCLALA